MKIRILAMISVTAAAFGQADWPTYGHDPGGQRYSPAAQITPENVAKLTRAWTYHMKPADADTQTSSGSARRRGRGGAGRSSEVTPLVVDGVMYLVTAYDRIVALDPETGKETWSTMIAGGPPATRGLEYWPGDKQSPPELLFGTEDGRLIAVNAKTGKLVPGFGNEGVVDMKAGMMNGFPDNNFGLSSPPIIYKNVVVTGAHVQEFPSLGPSGDTRGWDVHTGKLLWRFHATPLAGEPGSETWADDSAAKRSGTNVWGMMTVDTKRGIVYMPYGEPTADYWGGDRKGKNLYSTALVAADALTGKMKWYFQAVHHDTWDYDLAAPPVLFDVVQKGKRIPAVSELSKMGFLFILNRETGKPIYGVEERAVPTEDVLPGDEAWPTQPFPVKPPPLARNSFKPDDLAKLTPEHEKFCRDLFEQQGGLHAGGPFTHYSTTPSVIFPSSIGGGNWNPSSFDPKLGYLFVNTQDFGSLNQMVRNKDGSYSRAGFAGTNRFWDPDTHWPCNQPPWGRLFAINVNTGEIAWESVLGVTDDLPEDKQRTGRPNLGGSVATAGGLVFIGATDDSRFRAFDSKTGKELWVTKIDAGAHAAPITYMGKDDKQYVVVTATGGGFLNDRSSSDSIIAFALP
ncbi:MAG TPA: pyrroloquinoline quinone-dependent dehydrogenase [Bryobacteraceae bacterium]|nr:pyrroloquinoline quinone-dependent dehydrogenase [Bryobacteraceae bacterium]